MSKQQWGHGFHTGQSEGYEVGYEAGKDVPDMMQAEQIDVLIESLAACLLRGEEIGPRVWSIVRTLSEVNSKSMLNPERAWHFRWQK
jgi:hypothetical protein